MPLPRFQLVRHDGLLWEYPLKYRVNTGITYSMGYTEWDAIVNLGGGLEELLKWDSGEYPTWFMAKVVAFSVARNMVRNHIEDAVTRASEKRGKRRK